MNDSTYRRLVQEMWGDGLIEPSELKALVELQRELEVASMWRHSAMMSLQVRHQWLAGIYGVLNLSCKLAYNNLLTHTTALTAEVRPRSDRAKGKASMR